MELVDVVDSKSTDGDIVPVRVRPPAPINPIVNDTFTMGFIFVPVGLEPQVRVWGARGALPVADEATRASGSGRCTTQPLRRQGVHRAPQQDTGTKTNPTPQGVGFVLLLIKDGLGPIQMQYAGGILLPPVQKLVATIIFAAVENASRVRLPFFLAYELHYV